MKRLPFGELFGRALLLSVALQFFLPVLSAIVMAPSRGLLCTASVHGAREVPCSLSGLLVDWLEYVFVSNLLFLGLPTLVLAIVFMAVLALASYLRARRADASQAPE